MRKAAVNASTSLSKAAFVDFHAQGLGAVRPYRGVLSTEPSGVVQQAELLEQLGAAPAADALGAGGVLPTELLRRMPGQGLSDMNVKKGPRVKLERWATQNRPSDWKGEGEEEGDVRAAHPEQSGQGRRRSRRGGGGGGAPGPQPRVAHAHGQ